MSIFEEHPSSGSAGAPAKKDDRRKQTLLVLAGVGTLLLTYLLYRRSAQASSAGVSTAGTGTTDGADLTDGSGGSTSEGSASGDPGADAAITALQAELANDEYVLTQTHNAAVAHTGEINALAAKVKNLQAATHAKVNTTINSTSGPKKPVAKTHAAATSTSDKTYTVQSGDTLSEIAAKYKESLTTLESQNQAAIKKQGSNNLIHPGLKLKVS